MDAAQGLYGTGKMQSFEGIKPPYVAPGVDAVHWMLYIVHLGKRFTVSACAEIVEDLTLTPDSLTLTRHGPRGHRQDWTANPHWVPGVSLAFGAACAFACALWITDHKLASVRGPVRSLLTLLIVFSSMLVAGVSGVMPSGLSLPASTTGEASTLWLVRISVVVFFLKPNQLLRV